MSAGKKTNRFAAARRSAEARRCPKCGRKAALERTSSTYPGQITTICRWDDCDYARRAWTTEEWAVIRRGDAAGLALLESGANITTKPERSKP